MPRIARKKSIVYYPLDTQSSIYKCQIHNIHCDTDLPNSMLFKVNLSRERAYKKAVVYGIDAAGVY